MKQIIISKLNIYSKDNKLIGLDYLRVVAVLMILYDHLGGFRNKKWIFKRIIDFFLCDPLNIIQNFGAFGVSIFFLLTGFLFVYKQNHDNIMKKTSSTLLAIYLSSLFCFIIFWVIIFFLKKIQFNTYWHRFKPQQWIDSISLWGYLNGKGDAIDGTRWFLIPLFFFYIIRCIYVYLLKFLKKTYVYIIINIFLLVIIYFCFLFHMPMTHLLIFVFMPISGMLFAELYVQMNNNLHLGFFPIIWILNFCLMVLCFQKFKVSYYDSKYLISYVYAILLIFFFLLFNNSFKENKIIKFICKISLAIYLLQMPFGSLLMQIFADYGIVFSISFLLTVSIIIYVSYIFTKYIYNKLIVKLINLFDKCI